MISERRAVDPIPEFEVTLWGYDREQVQRCLYDLVRRLEEAFGRLESVEVLHQQLCDARVEADQAQLSLAEAGHWTYQLAELMQTAEALRSQAQRRAATES